MTNKVGIVGLAAALTASAALATDLNVSVEANGSNAVEVGAGDEVQYQILGVLTDTMNEGLALFGLDLVYSGGDLDQANAPAGGTMSSFVIPDGITNPAGYGGTTNVANRVGDLVQAGGGANTIMNGQTSCTGPGDCPGTDCNGGVCDPVAGFPIGTIITGVAHPAACAVDAECPANGAVCRSGECWQVLLTGTLTAPDTEDKYTLSIESVFANVITQGETGDPFWATEAAGAGAITNLNIQVTEAPQVVLWESVGTHGAVGDVGLEITADGMFSEPRICADRIVVSLSGAMNPATAIPANVTCEGRDVDGNPVACSAIGVATAAADTELVITFTPKLTDFARYRVAVSGLESSGGAAIAADERCFTMLLGDATGDRQVRANDVGGARSFVPTNPIDPLQMFQVRSDATCDGQVRANDVGGIRSMVPNNAQDITCP